MDFRFLRSHEEQRVIISDTQPGKNIIIPYKSGFLECRTLVKDVSCEGEADADAEVETDVGQRLVLYVSSGTDCRQACKFCHLTKGRKKKVSYTSPVAYANQVSIALDQTDFNEVNINRLNINFMAKNDFAANPLFWKNPTKLFNGMTYRTKDYYFDRPKYNLSTILPVASKHQSLSRLLVDKKGKYSNHDVHVYYSLYSLNKKFRKYWLPNAQDTDTALHRLLEFERLGIECGIDNPVYIHFALIEGYNDSAEDAKRVADYLSNFEQPKFNLVEFNTPRKKWRKTSEETKQKYLDIIRQVVEPKVIPKYGSDRDALACGLFAT